MKTALVFAMVVMALAAMLAVLVWFLTPPADYTLIGEGPVEEFKLLECPAGEYDHLRIEVISNGSAWGLEVPTVVFAGDIPDGAIAYNLVLSDGDNCYGLGITVREDGIGCMPTDYPYALTLRVYGKRG